MPGQHLPADHARGNVDTIGGYAAVHQRPAAFEGSDGFSYSVEIVAQPTGHSDRPWGAYLLFVQWGRVGATTPTGHLESDFLAESDDAEDARTIVGALSLGQVRGVLHALIAGRSSGAPTRRWFDVMHDDSNPDDGA